MIVAEPFGKAAGELHGDSRALEVQKSSPMGAFWSHNSCKKLYRSSVTPTCTKGKGLSGGCLVSHRVTRQGNSSLKYEVINV